MTTKTRSSSSLAAAAVVGLGSLLPLLPASAPAQEGAPPTAAEVLRLVRYSQSAQGKDFRGEIRRSNIGRVQVPLKLTLSEKEVRFTFYEGNSSRNAPDQILILSLHDNRYRLEEVTRGQRSDLAPERYGESVRETDITYEDLAMRFLYWPDPEHVGVERAKGGDAWKIRCRNPVEDGPYRTVDVWVSQESGALVKMEATNAEGQRVKSFEVDEVQRVDGEWLLREMVVLTHRPGRSPSKTIMKVEIPE